MKRFYGVGMVACVAMAACSGADTAPVDEERVGEASEAMTTNCVWLDPAVTPPLPIPVSFPRELLIRALPVVEDPCRTTWTAACPASLGAWTFRRLMMNMAGTVPVQQFVADWLHQWEIGTAVGPFPVPPRPGIRPAFINPWLVASGCAAGAPIVGPGACPLDLFNAPFRLLAIVNRADNATFVGGAPPAHDPEVRFVFGMTDALTNAALQSTVIFEYKLPPTRPAFGPTSLFNWASAFHALSDAAALGPIGSPPYLLALQPILDDVTRVNAIPGNPNLGSAIGQVRTNEVAFGPGPVWKMREFHLVGVGAGINANRLRAVATNQTPDDSRNLTPALNAYLFPNSSAGGSAALSTFTHVVPLGMQGGESSAPMLWNWTGATPLTPLERTNFGFATCNGCHTVETNTGFTHISPRPAGGVAGLSPILSQTTVYSGVAGLPAGTLNVPDPAPTGAVFQYNEPWRRVCEVSAILGGAAAPYTRGNGM